MSSVLKKTETQVYSDLETRFKKAVEKLKIFPYHKNKRKRDKSVEMEAAYLIHEIEEYGFSFFPEHYVKDKVKKLEDLAEKLNK